MKGRRVLVIGDLHMPSRARALPKQMVDILISEYTHRLSIDSVEREDKDLLLVDGGSATGVWGGGNAASNVPSFVVLDIEGSRALIHCFELLGGSLRERSFVFEKNLK